MRRMWTRMLLVGGLGLVAGSTAGCAQERPAINRVQADALSKAMFVGELDDPSDDPEFYMRNTVIDVGYGAAQDGLFTSTYAQPVSRIRWEITEDYLNARLSYERVQNSDSKGNKVDGLVKKTVNDGQIVASYRIRGHFDIRRSYNPTTGEEQNVIEENASDKHWYERSHFRVDWSQNIATDVYDFDTLSMMGIYGGIEYSPLAFTVLDPKDPNAPHFEKDGTYFDVTNKAFANPSVIDLSSLGWGIDLFPACYLPGEFAGGTYPYGNCNATEITLRQSFRKVVDSDFEPKNWDGYKFQAFGIFYTERVGYERNYGMLDEHWVRFADHYNLWERNHYYDDPANLTGHVPCATFDSTEAPTGDPAADPNRDEDKNGTADECEAVTQKTGVAGSQCDIYRRACTLPFRARNQKLITWYFNDRGATQLANADVNDPAYPVEKQKSDDLFESTNWAVVEWDAAFKMAINSARYVECRRTGGDAASCGGKFPVWNGQQDDNDEAVAQSRERDYCLREKGWDNAGCASKADATNPNKAAIDSVVNQAHALVMCHNPVNEKDHPGCGPVGLAPRLGDIRYHQVVLIDKPQTPSAWGIMVDAVDPLNGEKIAASINVWTHVNDLASQGLADLVAYMNGDLPISNITEGKYIFDWAKSSKLGSSTPTLTKEQVNQRLAAATGLETKKFGDLTKNGLSSSVKAKVQKFHQSEVKDVVKSANVPSVAAVEAQARMNQARGTSVEATLINQPMMQLAGLKGNLPVDGPVAQRVSPFALNNPKVTADMRRMRENALAERGACILSEAPEPSSLNAIADMIKRKFGDPAENMTAGARDDYYRRVQRYLMLRYNYAVIAHEMGHSVGLRHNFVSSSAALFFRPQYWQLRTRDGAVTTECTDAVDKTGAADCVGARYYDPITDAEQSQGIWMFQQSTVMDYPGDVSQDLIGLGAYDFAATRFFYGDVISVYDIQQDYSVGGNTFTAADYKNRGKIATGLLNATDTFGGLVGIRYGVKSTDAGNGVDEFNYSQLQSQYGLIHDCKPVTPATPAHWNKDRDGEWDATFDGLYVAPNGDGNYTRCRQQTVDYVSWNDLRFPSAADLNGGYYRGGNAVENTEKPAEARVRVPYAFASDNWADVGNVSVFRHDNGADPYEVVNFLIETQESRHIFDNYRRGRNSFNVRAAADRSYGRYGEKLLNLSGGIGFLGTIYQNFATSQGFTFDTLWPYIIGYYYQDNMVAASVAFDHFARQLSRPEDGPHYKFAPAFNDPTLRSTKDSDGNAPGDTSSDVLLVVPNGATGYLRDVGFGGHPLENALSENNGDYDSQYTHNAGSYYEKINVAILLSESEDRFISQSRQDFYDARFRAVGMADVLPEGYRRLLANALTGDRSLLAPHVESNAGKPEIVGMVDPNEPDQLLANLSRKYPKSPFGWTSWWPTEGPLVCFSRNGSKVCKGFSGQEGDLNPLTPVETMPIDPQVGWEVQKFLIAWTMAYIPSNQKSQMIDMMRIYRVGLNNELFSVLGNSGEKYIVWQDPSSSELYYARSYGKECLFYTGATVPKDQGTCAAGGGRWVEKGIAARVLEYANELASKGYMGAFGSYGMFVVHRDPQSGAPIVKSDPALGQILSNGNAGGPKPNCDTSVPEGTPNHPVGCTPLSKWDNHWAVQLDNYKSVPDYLWEVVITYGMGEPGQLGLYP